MVFRQAHLRRRRRRTTLAALVLGLVSIGLGLTAVAGGFSTGPALQAAQWQRSHRLTVWLQPHITPGQVDAVKSQLLGNSALSGCKYRTQLADYDQAEKLLPTSEMLKLTLQTTPASFTCNLPERTQLRDIVAKLAAVSGVRNVTVPLDLVRSAPS